MDSIDKEPENTNKTESPEKELVRLIRTITVNPEKGNHVDPDLIRFGYFNSFNFSALERGGDHPSLTLGITSANPGEGKTLVASNLAVSLAMGLKKETILVDLNFSKPQIHEIFGTVLSPGLAETFPNNTIHVSRSSVDHLSILSCGIMPLYDDSSHGTIQGKMKGPKPLLGLDQLTSFRDVIYTLEQEFEFIVVDLPSIRQEEIPVLFTNQLHGLLVVIDSRLTKKNDLDALFKKITPHQVLGFVLNRSNNSDI